ncbi:MAG: hypothetical protein IPO37_25645 [Saprospiraceae bacterium]|nr:hypothetical protein [Saprospiraceae bacterium]
MKEYKEKLNGNLQEKHFKQIVDLVYTKENVGDAYFKEINEAKLLIDKFETNNKSIYTHFKLNREQLKILVQEKLIILLMSAFLLKHNINNDLLQCLKTSSLIKSKNIP